MMNINLKETTMDDAITMEELEKICSENKTDETLDNFKELVSQTRLANSLEEVLKDLAEAFSYTNSDIRERIIVSSFKKLLVAAGLFELSEEELAPLKELGDIKKSLSNTYYNNLASEEQLNRISKIVNDYMIELISKTLEVYSQIREINQKIIKSNIGKFSLEDLAEILTEGKL